MKSILSRLLLSLLIVSSMIMQSIVFSNDFHMNTADHVHHDIHYIDRLKHTGKITTHSHNEQPIAEVAKDAVSFENSDTAEHCCHVASVSAEMVTLNTFLSLPKPSLTKPIFISEHYQNPISDSLVRPPKV